HRIPTTHDRPINVKQYRLPHALKCEVDRQVQELLDKGIIVHSDSSYNLSLWCVPKKPDSAGNPQWRIVVDTRPLNEITIPMAYPLPVIVDILDQVGGARYFTVLDCKSGFFQIPPGPPKCYIQTDIGYQFAETKSLLFSSQVSPPLALDSTNDCITSAGITENSRQRRLVNATTANFHDFSYVVSLQYYGLHICGGTIIRRDIILTAASCIEQKWYKRLSIRVGSTSRTNGGKEYRIEKIAYHADYHPISKINDAALLKLVGHINFESTGTRQVKLIPQYDKIKVGTMVTAVGWGSTEPSRFNFSEELRSAELQLISMKECAHYYGGPEGLTGQLCTRLKDKSACFGDAGGPLMIYSHQLGIASKAIGCTELRLPDTYTEVARLHDWISEEIRSLRDPERPAIILYPLTLEQLTYSRELQGSPIRIEKAAFVVSILTEVDNRLLCVGTIVGPKHVLTTARCSNIPLEAYKVRSGSSELAKGGIEHRILESFWYSNNTFGNSSRNENDIGIMIVDPPFQFDDTRTKVNLLSEKHEILPFISTAKVYGWDVLKDNMRKAGNLTAMNLQTMEVTVRPEDECNGLLTANSNQELVAKQICALSKFGLCVGPSGAPMMVNGNQAGILLRGTAECADYRNPGIFVEVAPYRSWIDETIAKTSEAKIQ
ncbi:hypothetical protein QAD02_010257, partial [Eretmocerus hayati]